MNMIKKFFCALFNFFAPHSSRALRNVVVTVVPMHESNKVFVAKRKSVKTTKRATKRTTKRKSK